MSTFLRESAAQCDRRFPGPPSYRAAPPRSSTVRGSEGHPSRSPARALVVEASAVRTGRRARSCGLRHRAGDDDSLDLARALVYPERANFAIQALDHRALAHPAGAKELNRVTDDPLCAFGRVQL